VIQKGMIMLSLFLHIPILMGHKQDLSPVVDKESFSKFNHGSIDWRGSTNGIHWLINSAETILSGESPKSAVGAGMTFGELEGAKMVMIVDVPQNLEDISKSWGFVISRIRQIHVLFFTPRALDAISELEQIPLKIFSKRFVIEGLYLMYVPILMMRRKR